MPTYQYRCKQCGHELEELQSIKASPLTRCPTCHGETLVRVMGTGAGLIFKGSGFYLTDYRKPEKKSEHRTEAKPGHKSGRKSEQKQADTSGESTKPDTPKDAAAGDAEKK